MKKITDERLIIKNLKNIRIGFLVQSLGILAILGYEAIENGWSSMTSEPLWFVFIVTATVLAFLQLSISVEHENPKNRSRPEPYYKVLLLSLAVGLVLGALISLSSESSILDSAILGGAFFLCILAPYSIIYYLRKKRYEDDNEE